MLSKSDIDTGLLEDSEPIVIAAGGSESTGYKYSKFYKLKLYYVPEEDTFVLSKTSINGVRKWSFDSLDAAIRRYNRLCEDSYEEKQVSDVYEVPEYVFEEIDG